MRWLVLVLLILSVLGLILYSVSVEFDAADNLQGHRLINAAAGLPCVVIFFVLAVGVGLLLAR